MNAEQRLKNHLLRGMADENIEVIQNQPRGTIRRQRQARLQKLRRTLAAGGTLLAIASVVLLIGVGSDASSGYNVGQIAESSPRLGAAAPPPSRVSGVETNDLAELINGRQDHAIDPGVIPLSVQTIVVDAGHGGTDSGTLLPRYGMLEKDITWDIANRLREVLRQHDFDVVLTRPGDEKVPLRDRAEIANRAKADLFVSIHVNWLPNREARGFETYFAGGTVDPFLRDLAAAENIDGDFSVADTRLLLDGIYSSVRQRESRRLADWVGQSLFESLQPRNPDVIHRGVRRAPFVVLVATEMPAILAEVACISNDREARLLGLPRYRQTIAEALFTGIQGYAREVGATEKGESS